MRLGDEAGCPAGGGAPGRPWLWRAPLIPGSDRVPGAEELKHAGAAMARFGGKAPFHIEGVTPAAVLPVPRVLG